MPGNMSAEGDRIDPHLTADLIANTQLVLHERAGRDRGWWRQMRDCWDPDGEVHVAWFQGVAADFIDQSEKMAGRGDLTRHRLTPPVVYLNEDRAVVEVGAAIDSRFTVHGVEADLVVYTRLLYRTQRRRGGWRIAPLDRIYERDTLTPGCRCARFPWTPRHWRICDQATGWALTSLASGGATPSTSSFPAMSARSRWPRSIATPSTGPGWAVRLIEWRGAKRHPT